MRKACSSRLLLLLMLLMVGLPAGAIILPSADWPCPRGSENVEGPVTSRCDTTNEGNAIGMVYYAPGSKWSSGTWGYAGIINAYVPFKGNWRINIHLCPGTGLAKCTIAKSVWTIPSQRSVLLTSNQLVDSQDPVPVFGGNGSTVGPLPGVNMCFTFVAPDGTEWSSPSAAITCSDGRRMPVVPSYCYLNDSQGLNVAMGTLDRGAISTTPGGTQTIKKSISVLCSGDAQITARLQFAYTPITVNGRQLIMTSANGLGVAVKLDGTLMNSLTNSPPMNFTPGVNPSLNLEFEAVRDPSVALNDIPTGEFTASAVLKMTQQ